MAQKTSFSLILSIFLATPVFSEIFSDAEIQKAIDAMRASGQSEAQISQFLQSIEMAKSASANIPKLPATAGQSQASDIQAITGLSDQEMSVVGPIAGAIKQNQDNWIAEKLREEIAAFEARYADKPEFIARFNGEDIKMRLLDCDLHEAYSLSAEGAPRQHNSNGPVLGMGRGWSASEGNWSASVSIYIDGINYRAEVPANELIGNTFGYDGTVAYPADAPESTATLSFSVTCEG